MMMMMMYDDDDSKVSNAFEQNPLGLAWLPAAAQMAVPNDLAGLFAEASTLFVDLGPPKWQQQKAMKAPTPDSIPEPAKSLVPDSDPAPANILTDGNPARLYRGKIGTAFKLLKQSPPLDSKQLPALPPPAYSGSPVESRHSSGNIEASEEDHEQTSAEPDSKGHRKQKKSATAARKDSCKHEGCPTMAACNVPGSNERMYCRAHKLEGMVSVGTKRKGSAGPAHLRELLALQRNDYSTATIGEEYQALTGHTRLKRVSSASDTVSPGLTEPGNDDEIQEPAPKRLKKSGQCGVKGCTTTASFGFRDSKRTRCGSHKRAGMINLNRNRPLPIKTESGLRELVSLSHWGYESARESKAEPVSPFDSVPRRRTSGRSMSPARDSTPANEEYDEDLASIVASSSERDEDIEFEEEEEQEREKRTAREL